MVDDALAGCKHPYLVAPGTAWSEDREGAVQNSRQQYLSASTSLGDTTASANH